MIFSKVWTRKFHRDARTVNKSRASNNIILILNIRSLSGGWTEATWLGVIYGGDYNKKDIDFHIVADIHI